MNVYQIIGTMATIQYFATRAYWMGREDGEGSSKIQTARHGEMLFIRNIRNAPDHGWAFLTGRMRTDKMTCFKQ